MFSLNNVFKRFFHSWIGNQHFMGLFDWGALESLHFKRLFRSPPNCIFHVFQCSNIILNHLHITTPKLALHKPIVVQCHNLNLKPLWNSKIFLVLELQTIIPTTVNIFLWLFYRVFFPIITSRFFSWKKESTSLV